MTSPDEGMSAEEAVASTAAEQPETPAAKACWPQVPAEHGGIYSFACPTHGTRMIAVTLETWLSLKESVDTMTAQNLDAKAVNIKLYQENLELQKRLSEQARQTLATPAPPKIITPRGGM